MKRETTNLVSKWKKDFSERKETTEAKGTALAVTKEEPVTFRLFRLESPEDFERMLFVIKAVAKNGNAPFKTVLHVERTRTGSRLVAADGKRLHVAEISKRIQNGDYKPHVTKDVITLGKPIEGIRFPSWAKAVPENIEKRGIINLANSGMGRDRKETEKLSLAFDSFVKQTGEPVNLRYLEDLTKREWTVYCQNGKCKLIVLREKNGSVDSPEARGPLAVILPIPQAA